MFCTAVQGVVLEQGGAEFEKQHERGKVLVHKAVQKFEQHMDGESATISTKEM